LSKASPDAYRSLKMNNVSCLLIYACVACALRIGSYMMVMGCMVVPFRIILIVDILPLFD
jgi:hypothetical protein